MFCKLPVFLCGFDERLWRDAKTSDWNEKMGILEDTLDSLDSTNDIHEMFPPKRTVL